MEFCPNGDMGKDAYVIARKTIVLSPSGGRWGGEVTFELVTSRIIDMQ